MLDKIFNIAGSALNSQMVRMNLAASNLANVNSVSNTEEGAYRAKRAVFKTIVDDVASPKIEQGTGGYGGGVNIKNLTYDKNPVRKLFDPGNPLADKDGYVYQSNVSEVGEMVDMMSAARSYQNNVETVNTAKQLMMRTVEMLRN